MFSQSDKLTETLKCHGKNFNLGPPPPAHKFSKGNYFRSSSLKSKHYSQLHNVVKPFWKFMPLLCLTSPNFQLTKVWHWDGDRWGTWHEEFCIFPVCQPHGHEKNPRIPGLSKNCFASDPVKRWNERNLRKISWLLGFGITHKAP